MDTHRGPSFPPQRWGVHETGSTPLGWSLDGLARAASVPPAVTMTSTFSATGARSLPATAVRWLGRGEEVNESVSTRASDHCDRHDDVGVRGHPGHATAWLPDDPDERLGPPVPD